MNMKRIVSEKRTQVYFPLSVYKKIAKKAKRESKSSAAIIRLAVEKFLVAENEGWENDSFLNAIGSISTKHVNASENHDQILYKQKRKRKQRQ